MRPSNHPPCAALIILCCLPVLLVHGNLQFSFDSFSTNEPSLQFSDNSNVDKQALQITRNTGSDDSSLTDTSGQITYSTPLHLWDDSHDYAASFNTSFVINSGPIGSGGVSSTGGGMTFMLTFREAFPSLPDSYGLRLGLFNGGSSDDQVQLLAIEFDMFKDSFDPDANHVGIDVQGSVVSIHTESLSPHNVALTSPDTDTGGVFTAVWIDYDGHSSNLDVYLINRADCNLLTKPALPIMSYNIPFRNYLPQTVYVGFSASLGTELQTHCVCQWHLVSSDLPPKPNVGLIVGCTIGGALFAAALTVLIALIVRNRKRRRIQTLPLFECLDQLRYGPQQFRYGQLKKATKGFSDKQRLGMGGFGVVYKGELRLRDGAIKELAVKRLSGTSKQGPSEFKAEIMSMGRMRHKNLVQLLGWSYGRGGLMLVYEYLPNGSLDTRIGQTQEGGEVMGWQQRFGVMKGIAAGLLYLHEGWEKVVIHRDLKPSNVMLDADFTAKIGDFGLAKLIDAEQEGAALATQTWGTPGYMAPELIEEGIVSKETDMYSLGVIALELATGHRHLHEHHEIKHLLHRSRFRELADPRLTDLDSSQLELLLRMGVACCERDPRARPSIREVVHELESSVTTPFPAALPSFASATTCASTSSFNMSRVADLEATTTFLSEMELSAPR